MSSSSVKVLADTNVWIAYFRRAGSVLGDLRRRGVTIPPSDVLIAVLCLRHELTPLENDQHFEHIEDLKRVSWRAS